LSSAWEAVKKGPEQVQLKKSPLLEAVARELLQTQQAGKGFAGAVVICELWRIPVAQS
jgi:hypothetical protein